MNSDIHVSIRLYAEGDLWLLERTLGNPGQMVHLNGPESIEHIRNRHNKFLAMSADPHAGCQFTILAGSLNDPAGNVGYWESEWKGKTGWEMGWFVLPEYQGRGIATAATRLVIDLITKLDSHKLVFAFPSVENHQSNAICRKLGFILTEQASSEYPPGSKRLLRCNIWMLTLRGNGMDTPATSEEEEEEERRSQGRLELSSGAKTMTQKSGRENKPNSCSRKITPSQSKTLQNPT